MEKLTTYLKSIKTEVDQAEIENSAHVVEKAMLSAEKCEGCGGIVECKQDNAGVIDTISVFAGRIYAGQSPCKFEYQAREAARISRLLKNSRIPGEFKNAFLNNYEVNEGNEIAYGIAESIASGEEEKGMLIYGSVGNGKSRLAASIANERIRRGLPAVYMTFSELIEAIKFSFNDGTTEEITALVRQTPFLVLDDLGAERTTPFVSENLFSLINARMNESLQTIITANYNLEQLGERLAIRDKSGRVEDDIPGKRIISRILKLCYVIPIVGRDRRPEE